MKVTPPPAPQDNARMLTALLLIAVIFIGYHFIVEKPRMEKLAQQQQEQQLKEKAAPAEAAAADAPALPRDEALAKTGRIAIRGERVTGSISLAGARLDDLALLGHTESVDSDKPVELLNPSGTDNAYYVASGWASAGGGLVLPDDKTVWTRAPGSPAELHANGEITLTWDNGHGLTFTRTIALDGNYLFTVTQKVANHTKAPVTLNAWHLVSRHARPHDFQGFFVLHEGPLTRLDGTLKEIAYKDLDKGKSYTHENAQGWLGITDKYWFVGLLPPPAEKFDARVIGGKSYQADIVTQPKTIAAGETAEETQYVFAGVKNLPMLSAYEKKYGFEKLERAFDFGMWWFIVKPFFLLLHFLVNLFGNVGLAILTTTIIVRAATFPLANKSFRSMAAMKRVAPQLKEMQEKYANDRERLQKELFELYNREGVNPFSGCWPILIQIPIFFALYKCILISVELRHAPFWGWIHDLSAADPTNLFTLFGLIPWTPPAALHIGAWPLLFCLTMILQQRLAPPAPDPTQEQIQKWFPYLITIMMSKFASGLVIYWTWSNTLGFLQQYYIMRSAGDSNVSLLRGHGDRRKKKKPHPHGR